MESFAVRLNRALSLRGIKQKELSQRTGINKGTISNYVNGKYEPKADALEKITNVLNISPAWLMGYDVPFTIYESNIIVDDEESYIEIPTIGEIAASFNMIANSDVDLEPVHLPKSKLKGHDPSEFISLKIKGDSMLPDFKNGDLVVILSQPAPDIDNQVGAVIYDGEIGTLKKVHYGENQVTLTPINPYYQPIVVNDLDNFHYIGKPFYLERQFEI